MTQAEAGAHFEMMASNLQFGLLLAAALTLAAAALPKVGFSRALLIGVAALALVTIYLNGWPYFRIFFFSHALRNPMSLGVPVAALVGAGALGTGLRWLGQRLFRRPPQPTS